MSKVKVVHFHNGSGGGVLSVIRNLIENRQSANIENHLIYTIPLKNKKTFEGLVIENISSTKYFYYSQNWNFYYICKQLANLIPDEFSVLVAHDWLELGMVSNLGLKNPLILVIHGDFDYYYQLATLHSRNINTFLCVSSTIRDKLKKKLPNNSNIFYFKYPVANFPYIEKKFDKIRIAYFVSCLKDTRKNFKLLPQIDSVLLNKKLEVEWHIGGDCMTIEEFKDFWKGEFSERLKFYGFLDRNALYDTLSKCNIFILPSYSEGYPVSVVESMKHGLVPFVSYWDGALSELVISDITGYYFNPEEFHSYAEYIFSLAANIEKFKKLSKTSRELAILHFDPQINTSVFENHVISSLTYDMKKQKFKSYGSSLDRTYLPNIFVTIARKIIYGHK